MPKLGNEFFRLRIDVKFVQTKRVYEQVPSTCNCNSLFNIDDSDDKCECNGTNMVNREVKLEKPAIPDDFFEHMRKAAEEYFNKD